MQEFAFFLLRKIFEGISEGEDDCYKIRLAFVTFKQVRLATAILSKDQVTPLVQLIGLQFLVACKVLNQDLFNAHIFIT